MTLISIILALALEYLAGSLDRVRNYAWFEHYIQWLEQRCAGKVFWDGPLGVVLTLALPLLCLGALAYLLGKANILVVFLLATAVFIYSLGTDLNAVLDRYVAALQHDDEAAVGGMEEILQVRGVLGESDEERMLRSILIRSHENAFGVIFWFIVLGMTGALLYCLVFRLRLRCTDIPGRYADAVRNLHMILRWPSIRLQAIGFALAGNLVDALDGWRSVPAESANSSDEILGATGIGATRRTGTPGEEAEEHRYANQVVEIQALINRTLIVWLTALGIMTLSGWLV